MKNLAVFLGLFMLTSSSAFGQDITITTQSEVDEWSLESVDNLTIMGPGISSLEGLSGLLSIENTLTIENTYSIVNLSGLENVSVDNKIVLDNNQALVDASALEDEQVSKLDIRDNPVLTTVGEIPGAVSASELIIVNNPVLTTTNIFDNTLDIGSAVWLVGPSFDGLNNIVTMPAIDMNIESSNGFQSLQELGSLDILGGQVPLFPSLVHLGSLELSPGTDVDSFNGLPLVETIEEVHFWWGEFDEISFAGLVSIQEIQSIEFEDAQGQIDFNGLEPLTSINTFRITGCDTGSSVNFEGLQNIQNVWNLLRIQNCAAVQDLTGLQGLMYVETLRVTHNWNLDLCCGFSEDLIVGTVDVGPNLSDQCSDFNSWSASCGTVLGCTNVEACNYSLLATEDDGSCVIIGDACDDENNETENDIVGEDCECEGTIPMDVPGCTYATALNYNEEATIDNGTCVFDGCESGDINGDGIANISDLLQLLQVIGGQ